MCDCSCLDLPLFRLPIVGSRSPASDQALDRWSHHARVEVPGVLTSLERPLYLRVGPAIFGIDGHADGTRAIGEAEGETEVRQLMLESELANELEDSSDSGHPSFSLLRWWRVREARISDISGEYGAREQQCGGLTIEVAKGDSEARR